eukprot:7373727-Prymnesium_polylepis.1
MGCGLVSGGQPSSGCVCVCVPELCVITERCRGIEMPRRVRGGPRVQCAARRSQRGAITCGKTQRRPP